MRNRILPIALALSMLAVAFAAVPTTAAVYYTGNVTTTDSAHEAKTAFVEGEAIYVDVELLRMGVHYVDDIEVWIYNTNSGQWEDWTGVRQTDDPVDGWYNTSQSTPLNPMYVSLGGGEPDVVVCDIIAYVYGDYGYQEYARSHITVMKERLTLSPDLGTYYPGQAVDITLVTMHTDDFYMQVLNETDVTKVNWTSQETGDDHYWSTVWNIAADFADGWYELRVRDEDTHVTWFMDTFWVLKYDLEVTADKTYVLPGDTVHMTYQITDVATGTPYYGPTIEFQAQYLNSSGNMTNVSGTLPSGAGSYDYTVPTDIALWSDLDLTFWANESSSGRSAVAYRTLYISVVDASVSTDSYWYTPSEPVVVMVHAYAESMWGSGNLAGADVDVTVSRNGTDISAYGATDLVTGMYGMASYTFNLIDNAEPGVYVVEATVSKLGMSTVALDTFEVDEGAWIMAEFDRSNYVSGESAILSFAAVMNNRPTSAAFSYTVYNSFGIMATGNSSGEDATVPIPVDYYGWIWVYAGAYVDGIPYMAYDDAYVDFATLTLLAEADEYRPGDTVVWNWHILTGQATASLAYWVWDNDGVLVGSGTPAFALTGSIEYDVPEIGASESYVAVLRMTSGIGGYLEESFEVYLVADYELVVWVEKSSYASGEFKPGNTITVRYDIRSHAAADLSLYALWFSIEDEPADFFILTAESEGSFEYTIPDDASTGEYTIDAEAYDGSQGTYLDWDEASFEVNNHLSAWDRSVGGMAMSDFLILLLIVVMIVVLIVMPFVKGRQPKVSKAVEEEPPPPAEPPKA